jgi:membrane associated rhomboid family serine protease
MPLPPPVTLLLIALNVGVSMLAFSQASGPNRHRFVFIPYRVARGEDLPGLFLSHLSHADGGHLLVNMLGLYFFGPVLEHGLGAAPLLLTYVAAAAVASIAVFVLRRSDPRFRVLGASGSVSGVLFGAIVLAPGMDLFLLFLPIPIPAPIFAVLYVVLSSYFMGRTGSRICHEAHVGGAVAGLALAGLLAPQGFEPLVRRVLELVG